MGGSEKNFPPDREFLGKERQEALARGGRAPSTADEEDCTHAEGHGTLFFLLQIRLRPGQSWIHGVKGRPSYPVLPEFTYHWIEYTLS